MSSNFQLLDNADEDALHKTRLLAYEERPFKRLTKRLLGPESILLNAERSSPTTTSDTVEVAPNGSEEEPGLNTAQYCRQFRDDVLLDFANFESNIVRTQFLFNSNEKERERYATEKIRIQETAQEVRDSTADLRGQLEEAQKTLALRKTYDELAEKITSNRLLKPRDEQQANLEKLENEITELERESKEYATTWAERREQFGKIIEEGMQLRRLIRDEKEEVERREGMEEHEEGDEGDAVSRGRVSAVGTPKPETGGVTPMHPGSEAADMVGNLTVDGAGQSRAKSPLRSVSRGPEPDTPQPDARDDIDMIEDGEVSGGEESEGLAEDEDDRRPSATEAMDTS